MPRVRQVDSLILYACQKRAYESMAPLEIQTEFYEIATLAVSDAKSTCRPCRESKVNQRAGVYIIKRQSSRAQYRSTCTTCELRVPLHHRVTCRKRNCNELT